MGDFQDAAGVHGRLGVGPDVYVDRSFRFSHDGAGVLTRINPKLRLQVHAEGVTARNKHSHGRAIRHESRHGRWFEEVPEVALTADRAAAGAVSGGRT